MMDYLKALNPMQRQAVLHTEGPLLIFAGAGSGKTRVLTYRIAYLIEHGVNPFHIIAITFTNKAAREMRERVNAITTQGEQVWVSTFHSTCVRLLRREIHHMGGTSGFSIFDTADSERLLKSCIQALGFDDKQYTPRYAANIISNQKNELIDPDTFDKQSAGDYRMSKVAEIYHLYQQKLNACNALDFDDIIGKTVTLFETLPDVLAKYQDRFRYVMVDEYQDTNTAQYRLISLLAGGTHNLCVVGDDDQSIYGWRGANIRNIQRFEEEFPHTKVIKLEQNYRSTQTILKAANAVIQHNYNRTEKALWTENDEGEKIKYFRANDEREEALFVAVTMQRRKAEGGNWNQFAVLYRNNAQSRAIEDQLVMSGIPYRLYGGVRFYERMEVKDVLAYLKAIENPRDDLAYTRIINVPRRGIGDKSVACILAYAGAAHKTFSEAIREAASIPGLGKKAIQTVSAFSAFMEQCTVYARENSVSSLIQKLLDETDYLMSLMDGTDEGVARVENVREFISKAFEFEAQGESRDLAAFLEEVALVADIDNYAEESETVSLMTLHSAKGLEFPCVFITGFEENIFPAIRSTLNASPDALEEERRLCYVGFTRAQQALYITSAVMRMQYGQTVCNATSRFYKEIPKALYEMARMERPGMFKSSPTLNAQPYAAKPSAPTKNVHRDKPKPYAHVMNPQRPSSEGTASGAAPSTLPAPQDKPLGFAVGDRIRQAKYGVGIVTEIRPAGADYEVSVAFEGVGTKKFMGHLSKLAKSNGK